MDWSNERYVRLYTRDTKTWLLCGWQGQSVLCFFLRKCDRCGILEGAHDAGDLAVMFCNGMRIDDIEAGLSSLMKYGVIIDSSIGLVMPNFLQAQEAPMSDAQRQREHRERRLARASGAVTNCDTQVTQRDTQSQNVTDSSRGVTGGHTASHSVTPALPSLPSLPSEPTKPTIVLPAASGDAPVATAEKKKRNPKPKVETQSKGGPTWRAYSDAYEVRYRQKPVRNQKNNIHCCQLVDRIGADEAPHVAAWYVQSNNAYYLQSGHALSLLVRDAEKLRTEWITGRTITQTQARQAERLQHNKSVWEELIEEHAQRGEKPTIERIE